MADSVLQIIITVVACALFLGGFYLGWYSRGIDDEGGED